MPSNIEILKIHKIRPKVGPLTPYKPPFNPINRPWDPSRSIELEKSFIMMVLRAYQHLSEAHFMPKQGIFGVWLGPALPGMARSGLGGSSTSSSIAILLMIIIIISIIIIVMIVNILIINISTIRLIHISYLNAINNM